MGFWDIFSRKNANEKDALTRDVRELKADFEKLRENVSVADKNIGIIYLAMDKMLQDIEKNAADVASAVRLLNLKQGSTSKDSDAEIHSLRSQLKLVELGMLEISKKMNNLMHISRLSIQNHDEIKEIKKQMGSKETASQKANAGLGEFRRDAKFSAKESKILNALLNSEIPLTYEEIAAQVSISPITVKGHINAIKKMHLEIIVESAKGGGKKAYSIKQEYRIRVLSGKE